MDFGSVKIPLPHPLVSYLFPPCRPLKIFCLSRSFVLDNLLCPGGGALQLAAVDLYANGADNVYYDDMSVPIPEPGILALAGLGLLALMRRRK